MVRVMDILAGSRGLFSMGRRGMDILVWNCNSRGVLSMGMGMAILVGSRELLSMGCPIYSYYYVQWTTRIVKISKYQLEPTVRANRLVY